jgi:hypothetical protein
MRIYDEFARYYVEKEKPQTTPKELLADHMLFDLSDLVRINGGPTLNHEIPAYPPYNASLYFFAVDDGAVVIGAYTSVSEATNKPESTNLVVFFRRDKQFESWSEIGVADFTYMEKGLIAKSKGTLHVQCAKNKSIADDSAEKMLVLSATTVIWVSQLLNCKNITTIAHDPMESVKSAVREHWKKKGKQPLQKYYTLSVRVPGVKSSYDHIPPAKDSRLVPLHTCRGHFSTYGLENKLFGKYTGTFWIPAHVRGSINNGVIKKDYRLKSRETKP